MSQRVPDRKSSRALCSRPAKGTRATGPVWVASSMASSGAGYRPMPGSGDFAYSVAQAEDFQSWPNRSFQWVSKIDSN